MVSVAMITYNQRSYLEKAVESVIAQEVDFPVEVLLGEDHSTDGTRQLAFQLQERYPDRLCIISSEANVGAIKNLVRVERACRGKYLAYCEGDDYWQDRSKLAKQVGFMEARADYSMVHSHCNRYYVASNRLQQDSLRVPLGLDDGNAFEDIMLGRRYPLTVTVMTRRDALNWVVKHCPECSDPHWPMGDTQRWLELSRRGKVGCIHEPLATTNVLLESAGQSQDPNRRLKFFMAARALKLHYLEKYPIAPETDRQVREKLALMLLQRAYDASDPLVAQEMFDEYTRLRHSPSFRARWLLWGSRSSQRRQRVAPLVRMEAILRSFSQRWNHDR
jgi:hypothetical protein